MKRLVIAALLVTGCSLRLPDGDATPHARQVEAVALVWYGVYGRSDEPPGILWVTGDELNCDTANGDRPGFRVLTSCNLGLTLSPRLMRIAWTEGQAFHQVPMAHEMIHAYQYREGVFDPFHHGAIWADGGIIKEAIQALADRGM